MNHQQKNKNQHPIVKSLNLKMHFFKKLFSMYLDGTAAAAAASSTNTPRWHFEIRRWKHTYYSLSFDTDNDNVDDEDEEKDGSLDVMIFFNYHSGKTKRK